MEATVVAYREELRSLREARERRGAEEEEEDLLNEAELLRREEDLVEAIELAEDLLGVNKKKDDDHDHGAKEDTTKKSVEELTRAADERDLDPEARRSLERASKALAEGRKNDCLASLKHCLRVDPTCYQASLQCGLLLASEGEHEGALEYLDKTVKTQPGCLSAYIAMNQVLQQMGKMQEGESILKQVAGFAFDQPEIWSALGMNLFKQGKLQEAVQILKYAVTGGPEAKFKKPSRDNMVLFCIAFFQACLGYLAEPCSLFMRICNAEASPVSLYMMAQACRLVGDKILSAQALLSLLKAFEMSKVAFCSELVVFNSTFDLPQWTDVLASKASVFRCLGEGSQHQADGILPTYVLPEQVDKARDAVTEGLWIIRGDSQAKSTARIFDAREELSALERGILQPYVAPDFLLRGCKFSLNFIACVTSYFPIQIAYNKRCFAELVPSSSSRVDKEREEESKVVILDFDEVNSSFEQEGVDCDKLWAQVKEKMSSALLSLVHEVCQVKGQARAKRFSALGLSKMLRLEFVLDKNLEPWVVGVTGNPKLKDAPGNEAYAEALQSAVVHSLGRQIFENELRQVVDAGNLKLREQVMSQAYEKVKGSFEALQIESYYTS
ncbi:hypothetical protein HOP50_18g82070 [Chloropicon primus]|uniref:Uncharacterized protein n=1 Tax=Chloropicon primus TaxID=1764295 RepID=A0A5B8N1B1_9CHLO|nr:hypothetical protein A3770_18p81830 [Chloropicon primus]UPR04862.1 hypothetical protein HOP50_18g82070 [Chloropicon primus]|eukprot:QDZ25665.1 hypothetical protein A3770_18p81830 [Chloropicon primus]